MARRTSAARKNGDVIAMPSRAVTGMVYGAALADAARTLAPFAKRTAEVYSHWDERSGRKRKPRSLLRVEAGESLTLVAVDEHEPVYAFVRLRWTRTDGGEFAVDVRAATEHPRHPTSEWAFFSPNRSHIVQSKDHPPGEFVGPFYEDQAERWGKEYHSDPDAWNVIVLAKPSTRERPPLPPLPGLSAVGRVSRRNMATLIVDESGVLASARNDLLRVEAAVHRQTVDPGWRKLLPQGRFVADLERAVVLEALAGAIEDMAIGHEIPDAARKELSEWNLKSLAEANLSKAEVYFIVRGGKVVLTYPTLGPIAKRKIKFKRWVEGKVRSVTEERWVKPEKVVVRTVTLGKAKGEWEFKVKPRLMLDVLGTFFGPRVEMVTDGGQDSVLWRPSGARGDILEQGVLFAREPENDESYDDEEYGDDED